MGYPQQLRVLLGIAKLAGAIVLLLPRLPTLKEWAYAGFTFTWIAAIVAHYLAHDGLFLLPVALLGSLAVSYVTRPANRRGSAKAIAGAVSSRFGEGSTRWLSPSPWFSESTRCGISIIGSDRTTAMAFRIEESNGTWSRLTVTLGVAAAGHDR